MFTLHIKYKYEAEYILPLTSCWSVPNYLNFIIFPGYEHPAAT